VLIERIELREQHVLKRHHRRGHRKHRKLVGALEHLIGERQTSRMEDQVDQHLAVVGLVEPLLRRSLGPHSSLLQRAQRGLCVLRPDHHIEVVLRTRSAASPGGQATPEQELDLSIAQRCNRQLQCVGESIKRFVSRHRNRDTRNGVVDAANG
jgi:hypothetical protein